MFGATLRCKVCNQYTPDRCTCNGPSQESVRNNMVAVALPSTGEAVQVALERARAVLRDVPMLTLSEVWLATGGNKDPEILATLDKDTVLAAVRATAESEAELYTATDTRCPDCIGSEFPGWKRGIRCERCNGSASI